jgi:hypothetical protein
VEKLLRLLRSESKIFNGENIHFNVTVFEKSAGRNYPFTDIEMTLGAPLNIESLHRYMGQIKDGHVMRQTLRALPLSENNLQRRFDDSHPSDWAKNTTTSYSIENRKNLFLKSLGYGLDDDGARLGLWGWVGPNNSSDGSFGSRTDALEDAWLVLSSSCIVDSKLTEEQWESMSLEKQMDMLARHNESPTQKATRFFDELMHNTESLAELGTQFGLLTLADICYLQQAILNNTSIDVWPGSKILTVLNDLTASGDEWRDVFTTEYDENDQVVRMAINSPAVLDAVLDTSSDRPS